jgi:hypothetical protein
MKGHNTDLQIPESTAFWKVEYQNNLLQIDKLVPLVFQLFQKLYIFPS